MEISKPSLEKYFNLPNPGLRAYFKHNVDGSNDDYRPPFWSELSREEVLKLWQQRIDNSVLHANFPTLYEYELEMKAKVGPMSIQQPLSRRKESIESYFTDVKLRSEPLDKVAVDATVKFFSPAGGIRVRSKERTLNEMRLDTNSGNPWFEKRILAANAAKASYVYYDQFSKEWKIATPSGEYSLCAILGWRGQEGGPLPEDVKQRVIWMMSMGLNLTELQTYQPFIASMQRVNLIPAYVSMDAVDRKVTELFRSKGANDIVMCTDFSRFDQHFNKDMQDGALQVESRLLADESSRREHERIFNAKFEIPIICSEDMMISGPHGMGSGSGGTNFDECMAHKILQFEAAIRKGRTLNVNSMAYGDDGILTYPGMTAEDVIETYGRHGQEMNPQKQYVSKHDCVVLRRWHSTQYVIRNVMVGVYSTFRALGRLLAQERFYDPEIWSKEMVVLRALSILENCKWHPLFHTFVDFVISGDRYRLGLEIPGFFDTLSRRAKEAIDKMDDFLGFTKTIQNSRRDGGIMDWAVVQYLLTKVKR